MSRIRDHFYEIEELELRQMNKYIITALLILSLSATAAGCAQKQQSPSSIPAETPHSDVMIRPAATEGPSETSQISESMEDTLGHLKLTSYVSRHSWATTVHRQHVPLPVISQSMGHDSERTTEIYLKSLEGGCHS